MGKFSSVRSSSKKKGGSGIVKFKFVVEKLQKRLLLGRNKEGCDSTYVPEDVKEGHFAVIAEGGEEPKRFVLPLSCLNNPTFLKLLEEAAEEYGFDHEGALTIPCRPSELERILAQQWHGQRTETTGLRWTCNKTMVF
ncbi:auxin-responsive protein SAUR50 [Abrus precatorius]|uniref:Auxin-responsive protein SAUR50 n=1 Tax=Abrus precatorius TaxID=3816 RepID=A0A8B8KHX8_ABRPR|nr:auxin-responsive protein SAUR50 [Abrus precatorius]